MPESLDRVFPRRVKAFDPLSMAEPSDPSMSPEDVLQSLAVEALEAKRAKNVNARATQGEQHVGPVTICDSQPPDDEPLRGVPSILADIVIDRHARAQWPNPEHLREEIARIFAEHFEGLTENQQRAIAVTFGFGTEDTENKTPAQVRGLTKIDGKTTLSTVNGLNTLGPTIIGILYPTGKAN